ncbi:MAG: hypothetical protein DI537_14000 [Stutzerimonas stutzeri]|nr:MAG: hypothetical protein DI537_14000 [Stutzerimonas stutzeri]
MATLRNVERLIRVLRDDHLAVDGEAIGFNMGTFVGHTSSHASLEDRFGFNCRTVACIAGHCYLMATSASISEAINADSDEIETVAADFLGIDTEQANLLFFDLPEHMSLEDVTPLQAIATLERLKETGKVIWH